MGGSSLKLRLSTFMYMCKERKQLHIGAGGQQEDNKTKGGGGLMSIITICLCMHDSTFDSRLEDKHNTFLTLPESRVSCTSVLSPCISPRR